MPAGNPSSHNDLIVINIALSLLSSGQASLTSLLIMQDDVTPDGGIFAEYFNQDEVDLDVVATNLDTISAALATKAFGQLNRIEKIAFGAVDLTGSAQTVEAALAAIIAAGNPVYGVAYANRTETRQVALATDIETRSTAGTDKLVCFLQTDDADWKSAGVPAAFSTLAAFERTIMYFHDDNLETAGADRLEICAAADRFAFSPDEDSVPWNHPVLLVDDLATALTQAEKVAMRDTNNCNVALPQGTLTQFMIQDGSNLAGRDFSHIITADWYETRGKERLSDILVQRAADGKKVGVNVDGQALLGGALRQLGKDGEDIGHFDTDTFVLVDEAITAADRTNRQLRFSGSAVAQTGVVRVEVNLNFT